MANLLVLYATHEGQTAKIATRISAVLRSKGHDVELVDADRPGAELDLTRFEAACLGGPIHAGGYPASIARFARKRRAWLESVDASFFSVGLAVASRTANGRAQTQKCVDAFVRQTGWHPRHIEFIAGALPYTKYNFLIRWVMRRIVSKAGGDTNASRDYEYTDWNAVERFASGLANPRRTPPLETRATSAGRARETGELATLLPDDRAAEATNAP